MKTCTSDILTHRVAPQRLSQYKLTQSVYEIVHYLMPSPGLCTICLIISIECENGMSLLLLKFFWLKRWCNNFSDVYWLFVFLLWWIAYLYTFCQLRSLKDVYFFIIDSYELFIYYLTHLLNWKTSPVVTHLGTSFKVYFSSIILSNVSDLYNSVFCISLERTFPT